MLAAVVPIALLAALMYALSDFLEQRAASLESEQQGPITAHTRVGRVLQGAGRTMRRLVRNKRWLLGWAVGTAALLVQAAALHLGSVGVVQTVQVTTLLFAIPLSTVYTSARPGLRDYTGGALVCAGVATVIAVRGHGVASAHKRPSPLLFLLISAAVVALVLLAVGTPRRVKVIILATAAGVALGMGAALVKLTTHDLTTVGVGGTARDWPGYSFAVATGVGMVVQQLAFSAGRLAAATTAMTVVNPLVGYVIAVIGFGERLPTGGLLVGLALGGACAAVGVTLLAHSPVLFGESPQPTSSSPAPAAAGAGGWAGKPMTSGRGGP